MSSNGGREWVRVPKRGLDKLTSQVGNLSGTVRQIPDWMLNAGEQAKLLIKNPQSFILTVVLGWFWHHLVFPIFEGIVRAGELLIEGILILFFGLDRTFGATGSVGYADLTPWFARTLAQVVSVPVSAVFGVMVGFNDTIVSIAMAAGIAGPPVATVLIMVEIGAVVFAVWTILQSVDIPFINVGRVASAAVAPFRMVVRFVR